MKLTRRRLYGAIGVLAVATAGGVALAGADEPSEPAVDAVPEVPRHHRWCDPIMAVLTGEAQAGNQFAKAGLGSDQVPIDMLSDWKIGSLTCASTGIDERVRGVFIDLVDGDGETVAYWLLLHQDEVGKANAWMNYLADTARPNGWEPADYVVHGSTVVALREAADRSTVTIDGSKPTVSMWNSLVESMVVTPSGAEFR